MLATEHKTTGTGKFDALAFAKRMENVGFTRQQAEALAEERNAEIDEKLATKTDIELIRADVEKLSLKTKADIELVRADLATGLAKTAQSIAESKASIIVWVVGAFAAIIAAQTAFLSLGKFHS